MAYTPEQIRERRQLINEMTVREMNELLDQAARDAALRRGVDRLRDRLWASWKEGALNTAVSPLARELDAMLNEDAK